MKAPIPPKGDEGPEGIFRAVGIALTAWETLEDIQFDCFVAVCGPHEPTAVETYVEAPRQRRFVMLKSACERYGPELPDGAAQRMILLAKEGNKLGTTRNEIAHGRCEKHHSTVDEVVVLDGHYLMPSKGYPWVAGVPKHRYAHTQSSLAAFVESVRKITAAFIDIYVDLINSERYQALMRDPKIMSRLYPTP